MANQNHMQEQPDAKKEPVGSNSMSLIVASRMYYTMTKQK